MKKIREEKRPLEKEAGNLGHARGHAEAKLKKERKRLVKEQVLMAWHWLQQR